MLTTTFSTKTGVACTQWVGVGCAAAVLPNHPAAKAALAAGIASAAGNTQDAIGKWKKASDAATKKKEEDAQRLPTHNPPANNPPHTYPPAANNRPAQGLVPPPPKGPARSTSNDAQPKEKEKYLHRNHRPNVVV